MKHVCAPFGGLVVAIVILAGSASAADHGPTIQIGRDRVALDDRVQVRGDHWPVGDLVNIELYGNDALDASADCDLRNSVSFAVRGRVRSSARSRSRTRRSRVPASSACPVLR